MVSALRVLLVSDPPVNEKQLKLLGTAYVADQLVHVWVTLVNSPLTYHLADVAPGVGFPGHPITQALLLEDVPLKPPDRVFPYRGLTSYMQPRVCKVQVRYSCAIGVLQKDTNLVVR